MKGPKYKLEFRRNLGGGVTRPSIGEFPCWDEDCVEKLFNISEMVERAFWNVGLPEGQWIEEYTKSLTGIPFTKWTKVLG